MPLGILLVISKEVEGFATHGLLARQVGVRERLE